MDAVFDALQAAVAREETIEASAKAFIGQLVAQVAALPNQDAATRALVERMTASQDALATALTANTPVGQPVDVPPATTQAPATPGPTPGDMNQQTTAGSTTPVQDTTVVTDSAAPIPTPAPVAPTPTPDTTTPAPADPAAPKT